jgi:hypothetical protein
MRGKDDPGGDISISGIPKKMLYRDIMMEI